MASMMAVASRVGNIFMQGLVRGGASATSKLTRFVAQSPVMLEASAARL